MKNFKNFSKLVAIFLISASFLMSQISMGPAQFMVFGSNNPIERASAADIYVPDPVLKKEIQNAIYADNNTWVPVWIPKSETTTALGSPPAGAPEDLALEIYQDCTYSWYFQSASGDTATADDYVDCDEWAPEYEVESQDFTSTTWTYEIDKGHQLWLSANDVQLNDETATLLKTLTVYGAASVDLVTNQISLINPIKSLAGLNRFTSLTSLTFSLEDFSTFDSNWLLGLPKLDRLELDGCLLKALPKFSLPTLTFMNLSNNQITEVPDDAFAGLPLLGVVMLDGNRIPKLTDTAFKSLSLSYASIVDQTASLLGVRDSFSSPIELKNDLVYLYDLEGMVESVPGEYGLTSTNGHAVFYSSFKNSYTGSACVSFDLDELCTNYTPAIFTNRLNFSGDLWVRPAVSVINQLPYADGNVYKFVDVSSKKVGKNRAASITWLAKTGITVGAGCNSKGIGKNCKFMPNSKVNRGAMAQFLQKLAGVSDAQLANDVKTLSNNFTDLNMFISGKNKNIPRYNAIIWLANTGITSGCDDAKTKFCPEDLVNRGAMAQFMQRFANFPNVPSEASKFPDVTVGGVNMKYGKSKTPTFVAAVPAARIGAINWLSDQKITAGSDYTMMDNNKFTTFRPQDPVTRGAMAQFMQLLYQYLKDHGF